MKRLPTFIAPFATLLVMGVAIASAAPPDDFCDRKPDHPNCSTTTTTTTEPPTLQPCDEAILGVPQPVRGFVGFDCDWTPENDGAETGVVNVATLKGEVTRLVIFVRDSSPGDICVLEQLDKPIGSPVVSSFPMVFDSDPSVAGFEENYWDSKTNWCERFDPIAGQREDLNGEPLHLTVNVRGKPGTEVLISLSPGQDGGG
jgi:hypothetical protein